MDNLFCSIMGVKHIYIPDGVDMDDEGYKKLSEFNQLESISITTKQFRPQKNIQYEIELRTSEGKCESEANK